MKRLFSKILFICLTASLFAAARPSLDGRAIVADKGEMPSGLFAKTVGYLPGDSVSVTNPTSGITIEVLILGAIDPSEGVAILLSPEAAEKLGIKKNSNIQVKITKRTGQLDVAVKGTAILAHSDGSIDELPPEDTTKNLAVATTEPIADSEKPTEEYEDTATDFSKEKEQIESTSPIEESEKEEEPESLEPISPEESDFGELSYIVDDENKIAEADESPANNVQEAAAPEVAAPEAVEEVTTDEPLETEAIPEEQETNSDSIEEITDESIEEEPVELEEIPEDKPQVENQGNIEKMDPLEDLEPIEEESNDTAKAEESEIPLVEESPEKQAEPENMELIDEEPLEVEEENPNEPEADLTIPEEETVPSEDNIQPVEEEVEETNPEDSKEPIQTEETNSEVESVEEKVVVEEPEPVEQEESVDNDIPNEDESYNPIILVPTESVVPESEIVVDEPEVEDAEEEVVPETEEADTVFVPEEKTESSDSKIKKYTVNSIDDLKKGSDKYYIQIAVLSNEENLNDLVDEYNKYPLILLPRDSGTGYKVLIGPLNEDEYGTILEKFRAFGFKDAFLKKIK